MSKEAGGASGLAVGVLGPVEVTAGGEPAVVSQNGLRVLLAMLALAANSVVPAVSLIEALWHEPPSRQREGNLHAQIYQLRRRLDAMAPGAFTGRLITRPPGYQLTLGDHELDLCRFTAAVTDARSLAARGDHAGASAGFGSALALWRGPALADVVTLSARLRAAAGVLEQHWLAAAEDKADADLAVGRHVEAAAELASLVAANPLRERMRGQLMLALYRSGRQAEALAAYRQASAAMAGRHGIGPGPALRTLHDRMLRGDSGLLAPSATRPAAVELTGLRVLPPVRRQLERARR
jgi:DNA-binding SARP family transcriptional activator